MLHLCLRLEPLWYTLILSGASDWVSCSAGCAQIYFVFMNTARFDDPNGASDALPNIIHLDASADEAYKSAFIRTCDEMLHARAAGETFGLAIAEFSAHNRPVLTSLGHTDGGAARFHIDTLGRCGMYYTDEESLVALILSFDRGRAHEGAWNMYRAFEPSRVMQSFKRIFLC